MLEERSREWRERYPRLANDLPAPADGAGRTADSRSRAVGPGERVRPRAEGKARRPRARRTSATTTRRSTSTCSGSTSGCAAKAAWRSPTFFDAAVHKSTLVGMFLAVLELVRHQHARGASRSCSAKSGSSRATTPLPAEFARLSTTTSIGEGRRVERCRRCSGTDRAVESFATLNRLTRLTMQLLYNGGSPCLNRPLVVPRLIVLHDQQPPGQDAQARRPDDRGLFAGGRADLLAVPGAEARLRSGRRSRGRSWAPKRGSSRTAISTTSSRCRCTSPGGG